MQLTIKSFRPLFPDTSRTFSKTPAVKISDISRFSIQVVTLLDSSGYTYGQLSCGAVCGHSLPPSQLTSLLRSQH